MSNDPIKKFSSWFNEARKNPEIKDATEFTLATANKKGKPSARIVLLKDFDEKGFVFYTNYTGRKSEEIVENPYAAICFYWPALGKQIRIEGKVEKVSANESDKYFLSRPRESKIGAWTSKQSKELESRIAFKKQLAETKKKFEGKEIKRPDFWGGWRILPNTIEFWKAEKFRYHHREVYTKTKNGWKTKILYP